MFANDLHNSDGNRAWTHLTTSTSYDDLAFAIAPQTDRSIVPARVAWGATAIRHAPISLGITGSKPPSRAPSHLAPRGRER